MPADAEPMDPIHGDWIVSRDGSAEEVLTADGTWGPLDQARWFASLAEAAAAPTPGGTTGTPKQQHPDAH